MHHHGLKERDRQVNWHPYTQMKTADDIVPVVKGAGAFIYDETGKHYIDAVSSWWVTLHGHAHPYIAQKVYEQLCCLEQVIFAGFTHRPAVELSERLLQLLPGSQQKVFYSDNGSTAVEVALKMCVQYWHNKGIPKTKVLAFKHGYHGDTFGAMSVSSRSAWTSPFNALLFEVIFIDVPVPAGLPALKKQVTALAAEVICFIYEPLVQGAGGMRMHDAACLDELMEHCREQQVLLIQDEILTGFGRTGKLFAADHLRSQPDIMCFSKGLTGGTMPLGVTTCSEAIYAAFWSDDKKKALYHGHSFTASPLACSAALASLDLLLLEETQANIQRICRQHQQFACILEMHPRVQAVRQTGTILALEWKTGEGTSYFNDMGARLYAYFLEKRVLLRPLGNTLYILPPYCISAADLDVVYQAVLAAADEL